ncbi:MAG TPA: hypothetical protein DCR14_20265 [Acidimicrobiaceae bacterium]|nr:hypothetical protein [Acidimicrobiaceae bacterium]
MVLGLSAALLGGCGSLPSLADRSPSTALADTHDTRLGRAIAPRAAAHPGKSGVYPLLDSRNAFAARVLLARAAERSLDVQYYIWRPDLSGTLLFEALHEAAERGVRTGGDARNRDYLAGHLDSSASRHGEALCFDPQTSGGLLAAVDPSVVSGLSPMWWRVGEVAAGPAQLLLR